MKLFLTNAPLSKKIGPSEWEELAILSAGTSTVVTGKIKCYRIAGTDATYSYAVTTIGRRLYLNVALPGGETFTALSYMKAWLEVAAQRVTEERAFVCDQVSHKSTTRLGWLNSLGGIDYYTFYGQRTIEAQTERTTYKRELPMSYTVIDRGAGVLTSVYSDETEVVSDFETPETIAWLAMCMASPEVWIMKTSTMLVPVVITSKTHVISAAGLIQLKIKYRKANDIITQNG